MGYLPATSLIHLETRLHACVHHEAVLAASLPYTIL